MSWTPTPLLPSSLSLPRGEKKPKRLTRCFGARARALPQPQAHPPLGSATERESARADKAPPTWVGAGHTHWCVALADLAHTHTHTGARHDRETCTTAPRKKKGFKKARHSVQRLITRQPSSRTATPKRAPPKGAPHTHTNTQDSSKAQPKARRARA